jgi:hypothetical protein
MSRMATPDKETPLFTAGYMAGLRDGGLSAKEPAEKMRRQCEAILRSEARMLLELAEDSRVAERKWCIEAAELVTDLAVKILALKSY